MISGCSGRVVRREALEICALTDTLILDEDGLYNPSQYNDRLLLGLKGTMSEAELHMLRARLQGGLSAKAQRGELRIKLPVGLVYDDKDRVVLHPDDQVQGAIRLFFETFKHIGTACGLVRHFKEHGLLFPKPKCVMDTSEVIWGRLDLSRTVGLLHNPRYAGAYAYGRRHELKLPDGRSKVQKLQREQWQVLLLDVHPGYISWQEYEHNQQQLRKTAQAFGIDRRHGAPREGPALLQGLAICGVCGSRMTVRYHHRKGRLIPEYRCSIRTTPYRDPTCQVIPGGAIDEAVGKLLLDIMTTTTLTLPCPLTVQEQFATKPEVVAEIDALLAKHTNKEVVTILNERGHKTGAGNTFTEESLGWVMYRNGLKSQKQRLRKAGFLTRKEMINELGLSRWQVTDWQSRGLFRARTVNHKGEWLFNPIAEQPKKVRQLAADPNKLIKSESPTTSTAGGAV